MKSKINWEKLASYNQAITTRIMKRLPQDWKLSRDDVSSEVNESFIRLIKVYIPKVDGRSLTSWCYQYAEKMTFDRIMKEYNKLKKQLVYDNAFIDKYEKTDDYTRIKYFCHQYGYYDVKPFTTIDEFIECNDLIDCISNVADPFDAQLLKMYFIQDMQQNEIAKKLGISSSTISKRMKKCINDIKKICNF